jgi:hypothetical protein
MIGEKPLRKVKAIIRDAFAKKGIDVETWLDQQMAKLRRAPQPSPRALETLHLLRDALRASGTKPSARKGKAKKLKGKGKPAA